MKSAMGSEFEKLKIHDKHCCWLLYPDPLTVPEILLAPYFPLLLPHNKQSIPISLYFPNFLLTTPRL